MSHRTLFRAFALALALGGLAGTRPAQAQDWGDYLHWPYVPPQVPGNGFTYNSLYDGFYQYPREQRIVPQIQGPNYRNWYGGRRVLGHRIGNSVFHGPEKDKWYQGYHYILDVF